MDLKFEDNGLDDDDDMMVVVDVSLLTIAEWVAG